MISTIIVGGGRAWEHDVFIPRKYGIFQPVGDTAMPGCISRAMRMIPEMTSITNDILSICPKLFFFNYSNPMTVICKAVSKVTSFPIIGLCHGVNNTEKYLAKFSALGKKNMTTYAIGINHLTFIYDTRYKGEDIKSLIKRKITEVTNYFDKIKKQVQYYMKETREYQLFTKQNLLLGKFLRHMKLFLCLVTGILPSFSSKDIQEGNNMARRL